MSKFSKRAKFLSILAAASAVGKAGAGAVTIPDHKYIPASVEAQNAAKLEKNFGVNTSRNNLQITPGPRFSIEPKSVAMGAVGATALGAAGLLVKNLFFNESRDAVNFFIELCKEAKKCYFKFNIGNAFTEFEDVEVSHALDKRASKIENESYKKVKGIKDEEKIMAASFEKNEIIGREKRLYEIGKVEIVKTLPTSGIDEPASLWVYAGPDGKIHVNFEGEEFLAEDFEKEKGKELSGLRGSVAKESKKMFKIVMCILNSRLVKEVLGEALKNKNYFDSQKIPAKPYGSGHGMSNPSMMNNPMGNFGTGMIIPQNTDTMGGPSMNLSNFGSNPTGMFSSNFMSGQGGTSDNPNNPFNNV